LRRKQGADSRHVISCFVAMAANARKPWAMNYSPTCSTWSPPGPGRWTWIALISS